MALTGDLARANFTVSGLAYTLAGNRVKTPCAFNKRHGVCSGTRDWILGGTVITCTCGCGKLTVDIHGVICKNVCMANRAQIDAGRLALQQCNNAASGVPCECKRCMRLYAAEAVRCNQSINWVMADVQTYMLESD